MVLQQTVDGVDESAARQTVEHARRLAITRIEFVKIHHDRVDAIERGRAVLEHRAFGAFDIELQEIDAVAFDDVPQPQAWDRNASCVDGARKTVDHSGVAAFRAERHRAGRSPECGVDDFHVGGVISPQLAILFELQLNAQTIDPYSGAPLQAVGNTKVFVGDV